jgi:hypothetical protein
MASSTLRWPFMSFFTFSYSEAEFFQHPIFLVAGLKDEMNNDDGKV